MKTCKCVPEVANPQYRAALGTGGVCIFSPGATVEEAIGSLALHAKKDGIPQRAWVEAWVETLRGEFVRDIPLSELREVKP